MKNLISCAEELNEVLGLSPKIKTVGVTKETIAAKILEAAGYLEPDDEISDTTTKTIKAIQKGKIDKDETPVPAKKQKPAPEPEPEPDDDDAVFEDEDEQEGDDVELSLEERLKLAKKTDELQQIIAEFPEVFKKHKKILEAAKNPIMLKKAMKEAGGIVSAPKPEKVKKEKGAGGPGIISSIAEFIENAGKKGITKEEILEKLVVRFPDREEKSMKSTINVQIPGRMSREKFEIGVTDSGKFFKK